MTGILWKKWAQTQFWENDHMSCIPSSRSHKTQRFGKVRFHFGIQGILR